MRSKTERRGALRGVATLLAVGLALSGLAGKAAAAAPETARELTFGQNGTEDGEFRFPEGVALTADRQVLVTDARLGTVSVFSQFGKFLRRLEPLRGALEGPTGVAIAPGGTAYVVETRGNRIRKFDASGLDVGSFGRSGSAPGLFASPRDVACDSRGRVYVADYYNGRIQELDGDGRFVREYVYRTVDRPERQKPVGVGIDGRDRVFGVYPEAERVVRFDVNGVPDLEIGASDGAALKLPAPRKVAFDIRDNIYVSEVKTHEVRKYDEAGVLQTRSGGRGSDRGKFREPQGIAVDAEGNLYVADSGNQRIQISMVSDLRRNLNLGLYNFRRQEYATAAKHYDAVIALDPENVEAKQNAVTVYRTLGERALETRDTERAKEYFGALLKLRPLDSAARRALRGLVWDENRSELYYPTVALGLMLVAAFLLSTFFRFVKG